MKEGNIILTAIIQADGDQKKRPALILRELPTDYFPIFQIISILNPHK